MAQNWEGNVRELRNVVERAVIIAGEGVLDPKHAAFGMKRPQPQVKAEPTAESGGVGVDVGMTIDEAERLLIEATLAHAGNNKTRAALILGISTKTLHVKLRQYRMELAGSGEEDGSDGN